MPARGEARGPARACRTSAAQALSGRPMTVARLFARRRHTDPLDELAEREREVLRLIAEGLCNRAIAARIFVTERTVEATSSRSSRSSASIPTLIPTGGCSLSLHICAA